MRQEPRQIQSMRLRPDTIEKLKVLAAAEDRSVGYMVEKLVDWYASAVEVTA